VLVDDYRPEAGSKPDNEDEDGDPVENTGEIEQELVGIGVRWPIPCCTIGLFSPFNLCLHRGFISEPTRACLSQKTKK
jgi:hypothetical protein